MKILNLLLIFGICCTVLIGCSNDKIKSTPVYQKATEIKSLVEAGKWEQAKQESVNIESIYKDHKWKFQLLGDETAYNGLINEISQLQVAVDEQDKKEAKLHIVMIENYMNAIYFK